MNGLNNALGQETPNATPVNEAPAMTSNPADAAPVAAKKKRRGISNETQGASRKEWSHTDVAGRHGLFLGNVSVTKSIVHYGEETKGQFAGMDVPKLVIEFSSLHEGDAKRYAYINISPVESNIDTIPGGSKEWVFNRVTAIIKHLLDVFYLKGRAMTEQEEDMFTIGYDDTDDNGMYVPVEASEVVAAWNTLFDNLVLVLNTGGANGTSCLKEATGKPIEVFGRMHRYYKDNKKGWLIADNGKLSFPTFIGTGIFELVKRDKSGMIAQPSIFLDCTREDILPRPALDNKEKPSATANVPGIANIGVGVGTIPGMPGGVGGFGAEGSFGDYQDSFGNNGAGTGSSGDMPF